MEVPNGWKQVTLKEVARVQKGISYKSEDYCKEGEGYVFINLKCIAKSGGFKSEGIKYFKGNILESQKLLPDDLLIANTDLTRDGDIIGCPVLVPDLGFRCEMTMSMDLSKLDTNPETINKFFLYYILMTPLARKFMKDRSRGSTVLHLQTSLVPNFSFNIPTQLPEQSKIAEILSIIDDAIDKTESLIQKYQHIKQGLMQDLLTKGIDEHGNIRDEKTHKFKDSLLGRIPVEWEVLKIGMLLDRFVNGYAFNAKEYSEEGFPIIRMSNITVKGDFSYIPEEIKYCSETEYNKLDRFHVKDGDLIIAMTDVTPNRALIGRTAIVDLPLKFVLNQRVGLLKLKRIYEKEYLHYYCNSHHFLRYARSLCAMSAQANLSTQDIKEAWIAMPQSKNERQQIVTILGKIDTKIREEQTYKQKLLGIKRGLMEDLLTGAIRVNYLIGKN